MKTSKITTLAKNITIITIKELARRIHSTQFATLKLLATLQYQGKIHWHRMGNKIALSTYEL